MCTDICLRALFYLFFLGGGRGGLYLSAGFTCFIWKSLPISILLVSLDFTTNTRNKMNVVTCNIMGRLLSTRCKRGLMSYYFLYYCFFGAVFLLLNHVISGTPGLLVICSLDQRKVPLSSISISFLYFDRLKHSLTTNTFNAFTLFDVLFLVF